MKQILFINACVRPESRTRELAQTVLAKLEGAVEEVQLARENILPLNLESLRLRDAAVKAKDFSAPMFRYARQFAGADSIVVAAPYWDLSFPSLLKIYFEAITVLGLTFEYTPEGRPKGLCKAGKLVYVTTAGGPILFDFGFGYIAALARNFYGIQDVTNVQAEGLDIVGNDARAILAKVKKTI